MSEFNGFPTQTTRFLTGLRQNNNKTWFDEHRGDYEKYWVEVGKDFVVAAGERLQRKRPDLVADPRINGSLFRINRDIRFSHDKTPYKENFDLWFWAGDRKTAVSGCFLRLTPTAVLVGAGSHGFDRDQLARYREAVAAKVPGNALIKTLTKVAACGLEVDGKALKRTPPALGDLDPQRAELAKFTTLWSVAERKMGRWARTPEVLDWAYERWQELLPLHDWLVKNVG